MQVTATDADDPTYGNSARLVYSILQGQPYFSVEPQTGEAESADINSFGQDNQRRNRHAKRLNANSHLCSTSDTRSDTDWKLLSVLCVHCVCISGQNTSVLSETMRAVLSSVSLLQTGNMHILFEKKVAQIGRKLTAHSTNRKGEAEVIAGPVPSSGCMV